MNKAVIIIVVSIVVVFLMLPVIARLKGGDEPTPAAPKPTPVLPSDGRPIVLNMTPANNESDVDPSLNMITVTFSVPMAGGFSWTGGGDKYPKTTGKPYWSQDRKTCTLPVRLKPNWSYRLGLNSPSYRNFKSADGKALTPVEWKFYTGS